MSEQKKPAGWDDPIYDVEVCSVCGGEMEWTDCHECFGEGGFDLYADDPFAYAPGEFDPCGTCNGNGGYLQCVNVDNARCHPVPVGAAS